MTVTNGTMGGANNGHASGSLSTGRQNGPRQGRYKTILYMLVLLLMALAVWSYFSTVAMLASGEGVVVPPARKQIIQHMEGGVLRELLVESGQNVSKGDVLARLDDLRFSSELNEKSLRLTDLEEQAVRLRAQVKLGEALKQGDATILASIEVPDSQRDRFNATVTELKQRLAVLRTQVVQRKQDVTENIGVTRQIQRARVLVDQRMSEITPLVEKGYLPRNRLLDLEHDSIRQDTELTQRKLQLPRLRAAVLESQQQLKSTLASFAALNHEELNAVLQEHSTLSESIRRSVDKVERTAIRSPVDGIINRIEIYTLGSTVQSGAPMMEVTPHQDHTLLEVKMNPADIGFLSVGQTAQIKLNGYDFAIYGSLTGEVVSISPDVVEEAQQAPFFRVMVRVEDDVIELDGKTFPVQSGMFAQVDIEIGERTVLEYLAAPLVRVQSGAFTER